MLYKATYSSSSRGKEEEKKGTVAAVVVVHLKEPQLFVPDGGPSILRQGFRADCCAPRGLFLYGSSLSLSDNRTGEEEGEEGKKKGFSSSNMIPSVTPIDQKRRLESRRM